MITGNDNMLVSCIMPTYNRRQFVPHAIRYFLRQDYENKELIILDDGTDPIEDLIPDSPVIRYYRLDKKITLGAKLNLACEYAKGDIIANWDDDDWYASRRLKYQVEALQNKAIDVCGINKLFYYDLRNHDAYQYTYPAEQKTWLLGSSLCYSKRLWKSNRFADIDVGMDGLFVWATAGEQIKVLTDSSIAVHMIHDTNASPKKTNSSWWNKYPVEKLQQIMQNDWCYYSNGNIYSNNNVITVETTIKAPAAVQSNPIRNIYACLVHENEDCIIDLVRNLHYHDPSSTILLYNGGDYPNLITKRFTYEKYGAVAVPNPVPVKHGYLHEFALRSMDFASTNFSFDTLTIVDSDQLAIRSGYSSYLAKVFYSGANIGMLSSKPGRLTQTNNDTWPAIQAFREFDLWKPFLRTFVQGENKFLHWTFWPSTVFTSDASRDLVKLFSENQLLKDIMKRTKIWATEEIILPTLVSLLGYDIVANPCRYDLVKYRRSTTMQEVSMAYNKEDVFWVHPVERKYENAIRNQIRQQFNNYSTQQIMEPSAVSAAPGMFSTLSSLRRMKQIEGWLSEPEADLLISVTLKACINLSSPHSIVEVGSYHGKSTMLLGSVIKEYFPLSKVYSIDPHEGVVGATDQGLQSLPPTLDIFKKNIDSCGLTDVIVPIKNYSYNVVWDTPISLLFIDGLHDYENVARDFWHFSDWIRTGGYIAFHDYAHYYPGVQLFVHELISNGKFIKIHHVDSLIVIQKL